MQLLEPLYLPIDYAINIEERTGYVNIPGVMESTGSPIIDEFSGEPFHVAIARPTGSIEFSYGEIGLGTTTVTGGLDMAYEDSFALFCVHHFDQDGLVRAG